jgi:hypothetical protein
MFKILKVLIVLALLWLLIVIGGGALYAWALIGATA